jgi:hypothetical protein
MVRINLKSGVIMVDERRFQSHRIHSWGSGGRGFKSRRSDFNLYIQELDVAVQELDVADSEIDVIIPNSFIFSGISVAPCQ